MTPLSTPITILLAVFCLVLPWSLAAMQITLGAVVLVVLLHVHQQQRYRDLYHPLLLPLGAYILLRFLSTLLSDAPMRSANALLHTEWPLLTLPFLIAAFTHTRHQKRILQMLLFSVTLVAVYGILQFFVGIEYIRGKHLASMGSFFRATGGYSFYLTFAGNQLMGLAIAIGLILFETNSRRRAIYLAVAIFIGASILATFARSTWLAIPIMILISTLLVNRKLFFPSLAGLAALITIAAFIFPEIQQRIISIFDMDQNTVRFNIWRTAWNMISAHPIWGIGPGFFREVFPIYEYPGVYDSRAHAHNDYLNIAVNSGIPAMLAWIGVWVSWFRYTIRNMHDAYSRPEHRAFITGSLLGISGILFAAFFQCYYTDLENNIYWIFLAAIGLAGASKE